MKMKHIAAVLATCFLAVLMTLSIGATDVTAPESTAESTVETVADTDAVTTLATEETVSEPTETEAESDKGGLAFRPDTLKNTLPIMGMGMLGIFLVTGVIVLVIMVLNRISNALENRKGGEDAE